MEVQLKLVNKDHGNKLVPSYATPGSAGLDLRAAIKEPFTIQPQQTFPVPTGLAIHLDSSDYMLLLAPRSGLAIKHRIILANSVGVVDSDYQNEIIVVLWNCGTESYTIQPLERIAQLIVTKVAQIYFNRVDEFKTTTERGLGGFGHSGKL